MSRMLRMGLAIILTGVATQFPSVEAASGKWVSGFYAGYQAGTYPPSAIDFSSLTHVMVFSVLPRTDGTLDTTLFIDATKGPAVAKEVATRAHAAGRKAILTVGGAGTESLFQQATSLHMTTFVQNLVQTVNAWGFDGIDIDWEPLPASDYSLMLALVNNLRAAQPGLIVTVDVNWVSSNAYLTSGDASFFGQLAGLVDQMNMMTYGMADNWGGWVVWHSSALYAEGANHPSSVSSSAQRYLNAGVPAAKLGMGIGFYGSCWNAPATAPLQAPGSAHVVASDNTMSFANIMTSYYTSSRYRYDGAAEAPYLTSPTPIDPAGCTIVSYEDETSVAAKGTYAQQTGLGGTIIWALGEGYNPSATDPNSLLHAVGQAFLSSSITPAAPLTPVISTASSVAAGATGQTASIVAHSGMTYAWTIANGTITASGGAAGVTSGATNAITYTAGATGTITLTAVEINTAGVTSTPGSATVQILVAPTPAKAVATAGTPQTAVIHHRFVQTLQVTVTDQSSGPVQGVSVVFTAPSKSASATFGGATSVTVRTNASGVAVSPKVTANGLTGQYSVVATAAGVQTPVLFSLTNTR